MVSVNQSKEDGTEDIQDIQALSTLDWSNVKTLYLDGRKPTDLML